MLAQLYYLFLGILKSKKQLISLDIEEFKILNILKFLDVTVIEFNDFNDGADEEYSKHINQNFLDGDMMNMTLIITKEKYGTIDTNDSSCYGYYIIKFSLSPYTLQAVLSIDV